MGKPGKKDGVNEGEGCRDQTTWALQDSSRTKTGNWGAAQALSIHIHIPCFVASEASEEPQNIAQKPLFSDEKSET